MFLKKNMLAASLMLCLDDVLDEEQVISIFGNLTRKNPPFPYWKFETIDVQLSDMSEAEVRAEFRFAPSKIDLLRQALRIPPKFTCLNGTVASGEEGLLMLLKRFAYPCRLSDMVPRFGRSVPEISLILMEVTKHVVETQGHLLKDLNQPWLQPHHLEEFALVIHQKGAALDNCWGFVDGTVRPICCPGEHQRLMFNGHKRVHGLKFQSVVALNGMIANLFGPVEGKRHVSAMLRMSGLLGQLEQYSFNQVGHPLCIYGDPAYPLRVHLQVPFKRGHLRPDEEAFNSSMSAVRSAVEWVFNDITSYFSFLDFKRNLKIGLSPVGTMYSACALLRNAHTCFYGSSTSTHFDLQPPIMQEYFQF
ncbi:uncharacterized protein [Montipora foliosa]|uniref:uncharacterized protein n=1 Tax=Montipora foliosa TaxID=591990 RepID=UPI0035F1E158